MPDSEDRGDRQVIAIRPVLALSIAGALVLAACGSDAESSDGGVVATPAINVGRTTDPVSQLMAEIYGQGLENAGYRIGRKDPVADQAAALAGLEAGTLQFVPQFTNSLLTHLAANGGTASDATTITEELTALRGQLPDTLTVLEPAQVDNGLVVACSTGAIDEFSLAALGDVAAPDLTFGATADFESATTGGLAALNEAYAIELTVTPVDDVAAAIADGTVDCGVVPGLSPSIVIDGLIVLPDDKFFSAADVLAPVMTAEAGQADVTSVVSAINAKLSTDVVRSLLVKVQVGDQSYDVIAKQFLASVSSDQ
jgi:osmoprotectant transport system substrate-binding protein